MIYLDNAAATRPMPCAVEAMETVLKSAWGNPNSAHAFGLSATRIIDKAKETVARCLHCDENEVYFCASATEAAALIHETGKRHLLNVDMLPDVHDCVERLGCYVDPRFDDYRLRFVSLVNNETGHICNIDRLKRVTRDGIYFAVDATAAVGNFPVCFRPMGASYLFCDALKFGGVPGCAILLVKDGMPICMPPHLATPHTALIAACASALENRTMVLGELLHFYASMREEMVCYLKAYAPGFVDQSIAFGDCAPHILSARFDGVEGTSLAAMLSERGVMVSTGAACSSGSNKPSRVLLVHGLTDKQARETIRISFSSANLPSEIEEAAKIIAECVTQLAFSAKGKE